MFSIVRVPEKANNELIATHKILGIWKKEKNLLNAIKSLYLLPAFVFLLLALITSLLMATFSAKQISYFELNYK